MIFGNNLLKKRRQIVSVSFVAIPLKQVQQKSSSDKSDELLNILKRYFELGLTYLPDHKSGWNWHLFPLITG